MKGAVQQMKLESSEKQEVLVNAVEKVMKSVDEIKQKSIRLEKVNIVVVIFTIDFLRQGS